MNLLLCLQKFEPDHPLLAPYYTARTTGVILIKNKVHNIPKDWTKNFQFCASCRDVADDAFHRNAVRPD
jgi:hypothetical protein